MARPFASIAVLPPSCASSAWVAAFELLLAEVLLVDEPVVAAVLDVPVVLAVLAVVPLVDEIVVIPVRTAGFSRA